mgnify:CR=1 FL=1
MKAYKVYIPECVPVDRLRGIYDEYFGHVIIAESPEEALEMATTKGLAAYDATDIFIGELDFTKKGIVLSDFNSG